MTNVERVQHAIECLNRYRHCNFVLVSIKEWHSVGDGVEIELNVGYKVQEFGFTGGWFTLADNPLKIDEHANISHIHNEDTRIILRIAYYILDGYNNKYNK